VNVVRHNQNGMKLPRTIVITVIALTIGMYWFWASVLHNSSDILEFDHPSRDILHSIEKGIFIDTLEIVNSDTIKTNRFEKIDILPTSSWIEKKTFWKSGTMNLDSLGLTSDTVELIVNFKNFVNGKQWAPSKNGYDIIEFQNNNGDNVSVYMDEEITQLNFKISYEQVKDTIRLATKNNQRIVLAIRGR